MIESSDINNKQYKEVLVSGFIYKKTNEGIKALLVKRSSTKKYRPGRWALLSGHVEYGKELGFCLKSAIKNQLSVNAEVGRCFYSFPYFNDVRSSHRVKVVYFVELSEDILKVDTILIEEYKWFSRDEIKEIEEDFESENISSEYKAIEIGFGILDGRDVESKPEGIS